MMIIAIVVLGGAYLLYGRYLQNKWGIDPNAKTPAYEMEDGVDYVPADTNVVFGHQFASIAGAGPINGPIQAAIFGWLPVLLWILIGGVFFGAVQDFASMYASVKNKGRTIGYIIEEYIGKLGKKLFLLFCWLFCILVVAAFADVVAGTFNGFSVSEAGKVTKIAANGAVATTSMIFILEAVGLGMFLKYTKFNKWINTAVAIVLLVAAIALGLHFPMYVGLDAWHLIIFRMKQKKNGNIVEMRHSVNWLHSWTVWVVLLSMLLHSFNPLETISPSLNLPFHNLIISPFLLLPFNNNNKEIHEKEWNNVFVLV